MNHQEQNREALIRHIADLEAVIRRRNEQIDNQAHNARETQRALEEMARERDEARRHECSDLDAHWRLDEALETIPQLARERDEARATKNMHKARADEERARADAAELRPLTPGDITEEMVKRAQREYPLSPRTVRDMLTAALTTPARPEGAEKVEAVLHQYWSGDINGDDLANRIVEEMNR